MALINRILDLYVLITNRKEVEITGGLDRNNDTYYQEAQIINHTDDTLYVIDVTDKEYTVKPVYRGGSFETEKIIVKKRVDLKSKRVNENGEETNKNIIEEITFPYRELLNKPIYVEDLNIMICNDDQKREGAIHPSKLSSRIPIEESNGRMEKVLTNTYGSFSGFFIMASDIFEVTDTVYFEQAGKICSFPVQRAVGNEEPGIRVFWKDGKTNRRYSDEFFNMEDIKEAKGYPLKTDTPGLLISTDKSRLEKSMREANKADVKSGYYTLEDLEKELENQKHEFDEEKAFLEKSVKDYKEMMRAEKINTISNNKLSKAKLIDKDNEILLLENKLSEAQVLIDRYEKSFLAEAKLKGLNNDLAEVGYKEKKINFDDRKMEREYGREDIRYRREDERWERDEKSNEKIREHKESISKNQVNKEAMNTTSVFIKSLAVAIPAVAGLGIWSILKSRGSEKVLGILGGVLGSTTTKIFKPMICIDTVFDIVDKTVSPIASVVNKMGSSVGNVIEGSLDRFASKMRCWFF